MSKSETLVSAFEVNSLLVVFAVFFFWGIILYGSFSEHTVLPRKIAINQVDKMEIALLPGVGVKKALAIYEDRCRHGFFYSWKDLCRVKGVGLIWAEKNRERISFEISSDVLLGEAREHHP